MTDTSLSTRTLEIHPENSYMVLSSQSVYDMIKTADLETLIPDDVQQEESIPLINNQGGIMLTYNKYVCCFLLKETELKRH